MIRLILAVIVWWLDEWFGEKYEYPEVYSMTERGDK